jgi:FkbM family methyltransferase
LLCERLAIASIQKRRLRKLRNTPARNLELGHIDSLELLEMARPVGINVIYDVGANVGTWTLLAKAIFKNASIEAFEPYSSHCKAFEVNCHEFSGISLHPIALGNENTSMALRVTNFPDASSMLPLASGGQENFGLTEVERIPVPVRRLDDYCREKALVNPDLIKLDVQGFELAVLSGAISVLTYAKALIIEVSFLELYERQCTFPEICSFLDKKNFRIHAFGISTPLGKPLVQTDVLFMKNE